MRQLTSASRRTARTGAVTTAAQTRLCPPDPAVWSPVPCRRSPSRTSRSRASARRRRSRSRARAIPRARCTSCSASRRSGPGSARRSRPRVAGRDVLVVMPTGSGKSLCYQLPALDAGGPDARGLAAGVADAGPGAGGRARRARLRRARQRAAGRRGEPAHARARGRGRAAAALRRARAVLLARLPRAHPARADRPVRGRRGALRVPVGARLPARLLPARRRRALARRASAIVASTATATPQVAADIVGRLGLRDPVRVATGFDRPNLSFAVVRVREQGRPSTAGSPPRSPSRARCPASSTRARARRASGSPPGWPTELGVEAIAYHAGLPREARAEAQRRFMAGEAPVVVATNAFGMGIDKADVRTVCHESVPELARGLLPGGRPRRARRRSPARCLVFATGKDKGLHVFFIERSTVERRRAEGRRAADRRGGQAADGRYDLAARAVACTATRRSCARSSATSRAPASSSPRRRRPTASPAGSPGAWDGRALALCRTSAQEGTRVRWRQYRAVWAWVEGSTLPARGHPAPLRRPLGARARPARAATSATRRSRPRRRRAAPRRAARPAGAARPPPGRRGRPRRARRGDPRRRGHRRSPRSAARARSRSCAAGARRSSRSTPTTACRTTARGRTCAGPAVLARVDALLAAGTLRSTGGRFPKLEVA